MKHLMIFGLIALLAAPCVSGQEMDQAQQEMMKKWQAFMTPGQYHEQLAYYTGDWTYTGNNWMAPGAPPSPTSGTAQGKMILGGRYLKQTYQGNSMGMTFDGVGITAFDNHLKMFHSIWIDSLGTGIFSSMGRLEK